MLIHADYFTCKKNHVAFVLSILVLFIHISTFHNYNLSNSEFGNLLLHLDKIIKGLAQVAVPLFFIISAALFYRDYTYKKTAQKLKSRIFTLGIPYLVWNALHTIFELICSYTFISDYFVGREKVELSLATVLEGVFLYKFSIFWFLFDLIVFSLFSPVFFTLLKNKLIGALIILATFVLDCFQISLPTFLFFRSDSIIYYMLGAYIGIHAFDWFKEKSSSGAKTACYIGLCALCSFLYVLHLYHAYLLCFVPVLICIWCISFWKSFDIFKNEKYCAFEKHTFLIYAMHLNIASIITKLIVLFLPQTSLMALINYILTAVLTVVSICIFAYFLNKYFPKIAKILGSR